MATYEDLIGQLLANAEFDALKLEGSSSGLITLLANATTTSYSLTFPAAQGGADQILKNDGSGNLSWEDDVGGATTLQEAYDGGSSITVSGSSVGIATSSATAGMAVTNSGTGQGITVLSTGSFSKSIELNNSSGSQALDINHSGAIAGAAVTIDQTHTGAAGPGLVVNSSGIGAGAEFRKTASGTNAIMFAENLNSSNASPVFDLRNTGAGPHIRLRGNATANIIETPPNTAADSVDTESLQIRTGNKTDGTGDSGSITLSTGTSAGGGRGGIILDAASVQLGGALDRN